MYRGRTTFRTRPFRLIWLTAITLGAAAAAVFSLQTDEVRWAIFGFVGLTGFGIISLLEAVTDYLILDENEIRFRKTFRNVRISKSDIEKVTWTKGGGTSVQRRDGSWVMVPDMGYDSQGMTNSIRAWLRAL